MCRDDDRTPSVIRYARKPQLTPEIPRFTTGGNKIVR